MEDAPIQNPFEDRPISNPFVNTATAVTDEPIVNPFEDKPIPNPFESTASNYPTLQPSQPRTFFGKASDLFQQVGAPSPAKSSNIVALSEQEGITPTEAQKNYQTLAQKSGLKGQPTTTELLGGLAQMGMVGAFGANPANVLKGLASYMLAQNVGERVALPAIKMLGEKLMGDDVKYEVTKLRDFLPDKFKDAGDLAEFVVYGAAAGKAMKLGAKVKEAMILRDKIVSKATGIKSATPEAALTKPQIESLTTPVTTTVTKPPSPEMAGNINPKHYTVPEVKTTLVKLATEHPQEFTTKAIGIDKIKAGMQDPNTVEALTTILNMDEATITKAAFKTRYDVADAVMKNREALVKGDQKALGTVLDSVKSLRKVAAISGRTLRVFQEDIPGNDTAIRVTDNLIKKYSDSPVYKTFVDGMREIRAGLTGEKVIPPTLADKVYEVFLNSILSNPETHARNIMGNTVMLLGKIPEKAIAATVDSAWSFSKGTPRTQFFAEIPAQVRGLARGLHPSSSGEVAVTRGEKFRSSPTGAIGGKKGKAVRIPTTFLDKADNVNKHLIGMMEKYGTAVKQAKMEGLRGAEYRARVGELRGAPSEPMLDRIKTEELYRTFQTEADVIAKQIMSLRKVIPGARYLIPFVKTPANIFKAAIERTPAGIGLIAHRAVSKSGYGQEQITSDLGKMILGSSIATYFLNRWSRGQVTGNAPTDMRQRDRFYDQGFIPNAIKFAGKWIPLNNIEPLGTAISLVINTAQAYAESGKETPQDKVEDVLRALGKTFAHAPYMDGVRQLIEAMENPEGALPNILGRTAAGTVPASGALRFVNRLSDVSLRDPDRENFLGAVKERIMSEIPGISKMVPARLNVFGEEIKGSKSMLVKGAEENSKLNDELERLNVSIDFVPKKLGAYPIDRQTRDAIARLMGPNMKQSMETIVNNPEWDSIEPAMRKKLLEKIERNYRTQYIDVVGKAKAIKQIMDNTKPGEERADQLIKLLKPTLRFKPKEIRREYLWD